MIPKTEGIMKIKLIIISLVISLTSLGQSEEFLVLSYSNNGIEMPKKEVQDGQWFVKFMFSDTTLVFILGCKRDSTYSYGYLEKKEEYDITPTDTANLVVFTAYKWYYANTYDKKEGIAEITSYRIFYNRQMILQVLIKVEDEDKLNEFYITAYNIHYKEN